MFQVCSVPSLQLPNSPNLARSSTPTNVQAEASSPESIAADETLLVTCAIALTDIKAMESQIWKLWQEQLSMMLPDTSEIEDEEPQASLEGNPTSDPSIVKQANVNS